MPVLNSASMGVMGSLNLKLDKLLLLHTEDEAPAIWQLRDNVVNINSKLVELSELYEPPLTVNYWMKDARELSYDIEDCIDQFVHVDSDAKIPRIDEISAFRARAEEVMERYHRFKLEYVVLTHGPTVTSTVPSHRLRRASEDLNARALVGMEVPRNELLGWLKPNGDDEKELPLKVVSILGVQGVGKSTLAQELWRTLGEEFESRAFVQASKKPNMRMILRSILLQVRPNQPPEVCRVPNLIHDIMEHLQDKRYFIIIDDLWAVSIWDTISRAFPEGNCCSRILTTTTAMDVALACCSYEPDYIFKMKSLSHDHSEELFIRTVFGSGIGCPQQFHDFATEITRKCSGLPLAITCIASLLANQPEAVRQWECVQSFLHGNLRTNPMEILKQVLSLCYSIIPHCLKTCLMYLSIYPENYTILKDDLVRQWIAEDFICAMEDKDILEVARSNFDELVSLGLIQRMNISCNKELSYVVHPMVFELITHKCIEDNFITIINYSHSTVALTEKIRRLSLHFGSATYATTPASIGLSHVRSLAFVGLLNCMPSLVDFNLVRVVIIHVQDDNGDSSLILTGICVLLWLRYLQVRCNATVQLPDQIGCLKYLETLEIHARVAAVPSDIVILPRLLHLCLGTKTCGYRKHSLLSSSRTSSDPITIFELPGSIPSPPQWIGHFQNLCYLDAAVRELHTFGMDALAELWALRILSLYVRSRTAAAEDLHFKRGAFPALKYFRYMCGGVILLTFDKEAMPKLLKFNIRFNAQRGRTYGNILVGIQNLLNLQKICIRIGASPGAVGSDRRAAESALRDAVAKHPCPPKLTIKRCDQVDGEYDHLEVELSSEQSELLKKQQHGAQKQGLLSNDQPGVLERQLGDDIEKLAGTGNEELEIQEMETTTSILLISILSATFTYHVGRMNPPGCHLHNDGNEQHDGDPMLLTNMCTAFFYCNSVAFVASLVAIALVRRFRQVHQALKAAITLQVLGLMGAYAAVSFQDVTSIFFSVVVIVILAGVLLVHNMAYALFMYTFGQREKIKQKLMETTGTAILGRMFVGPTFYYQDQDTQSVMDFYFNSFSFLPLSVLLIILVVAPKLYKRAIILEPLFVFVPAVMTIATTEYMKTTSYITIATTEYMKTTSYIMILMLWTIVSRSRVGNADNDGKGTADVVNDTKSCPTPPQTKDGNGNRWTAKDLYIVFLGFLTARVTYLTGLASPFGNLWQRSSGNPMMHDKSTWYLIIFFYSNAFSFVASFVVVLLLLLQLFRKRCLSKVVNTVIVLDLLGILVAHVASSCRSLSTIGYLSSLAVTVLAYFVIWMMLKFFNRSKTPAAAASASQSI